MTAGTALNSEFSYHPKNKSSGGQFSMQRLPNKQGSMADSYYNLMGNREAGTENKDVEAAMDGSLFSPPRPITGVGVRYEHINAQNINANIRRSMDKQQRVQTAQPNK